MASYTCNCFANKYFCCFTNLGCYYYPEGHICAYTTILNPTPICTCFPNRLVCCYNAGCYYKEPYNCSSPTASTTLKVIGSPTCSCFPNRYACGNGDLIFSMPETTKCYNSSPPSTPVCSCYPNKNEICCDENTTNKCTENLNCSSASKATSTSTSTPTETPTPKPSPSPSPIPSPYPTPTESSDSNVVAIVCGVVIPIVVLLLIGIVVWIYIKRRKILNEKGRKEDFIAEPDHRFGKENKSNINTDKMKQKNNFHEEAGGAGRREAEQMEEKDRPKNYERQEIANENKTKIHNLEEEASSVPKSRVSINQQEVKVFHDLKVETKPNEEIEDDALVVKREKERKANFAITEEPEEIQKGFGMKENIMHESEKQNEEHKQED